MVISAGFGFANGQEMILGLILSMLKKSSAVLYTQWMCEWRYMCFYLTITQITWTVRELTTTVSCILYFYFTYELKPSPLV